MPSASYLAFVLAKDSSIQWAGYFGSEVQWGQVDANSGTSSLPVADTVIACLDTPLWYGHFFQMPLWRKRSFARAYFEAQVRDKLSHRADDALIFVERMVRLRQQFLYWGGALSKTRWLVLVELVKSLGASRNIIETPETLWQFALPRAMRLQDSWLLWQQGRTWAHLSGLLNGRILFESDVEGMGLDSVTAIWRSWETQHAFFSPQRLMMSLYGARECSIMGDIADFDVELMSLPGVFSQVSCDITHNRALLLWLLFRGGLQS